MSALINEFIAVITILYTFVADNLVPADAASVNIIHVAIWTPVMVGLVSSVVTMIKGFWRRGGRRAAS